MATIRIRTRPATSINFPAFDMVWNPDTGELTGAGSATVKAAVAEARQTGVVEYTPLGVRSTADPLRDRLAMGIVLAALGYKLPPELADAWPEPEPGPEPEGMHPRPVN